MKNIPDRDIEHSETLLYHVRLLEELGEYTDALEIIDVGAKDRSIVDRTAIMEVRGEPCVGHAFPTRHSFCTARLLSKTKSEEAEHAWRALVEHNPDCYDYYRGYLANQDISLGESATYDISVHRSHLGLDSTGSAALPILQDFVAQIPKATAPRRLALTIASGDAFKELVKPYLYSGFTKGIPSLFADIKALYKDAEKQQIIEDIVEAAKAEFAPDPEAPSSSTSAEPTTYLWTLYFLAQHHSYLARHTQALSILDHALSHTPTLPELHTCKARALKRAGDYFGAARCLNEARLLDGQDRFLNTKCAKYLLRAGMIEEASSVLGLFTKVGFCC